MNGRIFLRSDGSLSVERAVAEDAGTYVCTAVNIAGSKNITVSVEIHGKTHVYMENITAGLSTLGSNFEMLFTYKNFKSLRQKIGVVLGVVLKHPKFSHVLHF